MLISLFYIRRCQHDDCPHREEFTQEWTAHARIGTANLSSGTELCSIARSQHCACKLQKRMGCISSKGRAAPEPTLNSLSLPISLLDLLPSSGPLTRAQIRNRILSTDGEQTVVLEKAGLVVRYAFVSLRGCARGGLLAWSWPPFFQRLSPSSMSVTDTCAAQVLPRSPRQSEPGWWTLLGWPHPGLPWRAVSFP